MAEKWQYLDEHLRLRLADLSAEQFERVFLHFFRADVSLSIERNGQKVTRRIIDAQTYNPVAGRDQKGIDILARVEGGETWVFQCQRCKNWSVSKTETTIKGVSYQANHYFLIVACDPAEGVQDEMQKHANWTFWNLDTICAEFRLRVSPAQRLEVLSFLPREELRRFAPSTTEALVSRNRFFEGFLGDEKPFRHDWNLVGREKELDQLRSFINSDHVVQMISAKGGEGKSRLLLDLSRTLEADAGAEVLFLNPFRSTDIPDFAFSSNPALRVIFVDDAHRVDQAPMWLLGLVAQDAAQKRAKLILATRPQGVDALRQRLSEAGLLDKLAPTVRLAPLKKTAMVELATQALGAKFSSHARRLIALTADSPFLTVVAADLLRRGKMTWGCWPNEQEFRQRAFLEFERKTLDGFPESDRETAKGLLRLLALLAPVKADHDFKEKASVRLGCGIFLLGTLLNRLRQAELLIGPNEALRVSPDLFADSLVYEACYDPASGLPEFIRQILETFASHSAALLRNLSEATWVARAHHVSDGEILKPLVDAEHSRFRKTGFYGRAEILKAWSAFSLFLPKESLDLADLAISLESEPPEQPMGLVPVPASLSNYRYVLRQIPGLLAPVAKYDSIYRKQTLDRLWKIGWEIPASEGGFSQEHPWSAISNVLKYEPQKPIEVTLDTLDWLGRQIRQPAHRAILDKRSTLLKMLLGPCFDREVQWSEWEGRSAHFCRRLVSVKATAPIRELALSHLKWVIENGPWQAALNVLSVLGPAVEGVYPLNVPDGREREKLNKEWLPERLKALALFETACEKHPKVAVNFKIRQSLQWKLPREFDVDFASAAKKILDRIPLTLELKTAVALASSDYEEFPDQLSSGSQKDAANAASLWAAQIREFAQALAMTFSGPTEIHDFLAQIADELVQARYYPWPVPLFEALVQIAPDLAAALACIIVEGSTASVLSGAWPALVEGNPAIRDESRLSLFKSAVHSPLAETSAAAIRWLALQARKPEHLGKSVADLLMASAINPQIDVASALLRFAQTCSDANIAIAADIMGALPIRRIAPSLLRTILEALFPHRPRKIPLSPELVDAVIGQFDTVSDIVPLFDSAAVEEVTRHHARAAYNLLRARIMRSTEKSGDAGRFSPLPFAFDLRWSLSNLSNEPDFPSICEELWRRVLSPDSPERYYWGRLFKLVVIPHRDVWVDRLLAEIASADSEERLAQLVELLRFDGSLVVLLFPRITRAFLEKGRLLGGEDLFKRVRSSLYAGLGPTVRSGSNGQLDPLQDYVEAEALKAAETHATDELLGPFYRWIVEAEQKGRLWNKSIYQAEMAALD